MRLCTYTTVASHFDVKKPSYGSSHTCMIVGVPGDLLKLREYADIVKIDRTPKLM